MRRRQPVGMIDDEGGGRALQGQDPGRPDGHVRGRRNDVVLMLGAHDAECLLRHVKRQLPSLLDAPPAAVVLDLSGMSRLSSGAVAALLWVGGACRNRGIPVRLRDVPAGGAMTLRRAGMGTALALDEAGS